MTDIAGRRRRAKGDLYCQIFAVACGRDTTPLLQTLWEVRAIRNGQLQINTSLELIQ